MHRLSLDNHGADKHKIRPENVFFFEGWMLISTSFFSQLAGSMAAIVANPKAAMQRFSESF
jgi:hypothetical protein